MRLCGWLLVCAVAVVTGQSSVSARQDSAPVVSAQALPQMPPPEGQLDRTRFPTVRQTDVFLTVTRPGRFAIRAESPSGTALQLVDMLTGPGPLAGLEGVRNGRLDVLLDVGTYKVRVFGADGATGDVTLALTPFRDAAPAAWAPVKTVASADLVDFQQRSFWIEVDQQRSVRIEAVGRSLADVRIWRDGTDLVSGDRVTGRRDPVRGHDLYSILMTPVLERGRYLVTAYGGPSLPWADGSADQPFHLRVDASRAFDGLWVNGEIGPFGSEVYEIPPSARRVSLRLPEGAPVSLRQILDGREINGDSLTVESRDPWISMDVPLMSSRQNAKGLILQVTGDQGQPFRLRGFVGSERLASSGLQTVRVEAPGFGGDEVPPTFVVFYEETNLAFLKSRRTLLGSSAPQVGPGKAWRARFNLRGPTTLLFEVKDGGPITVRTENQTLEGRIRPVAGGNTLPIAVFTGKEAPPVNLAEGWYELRLTPERGQIGMLDLTIGSKGLALDTPSPRLPPDPTLFFGGHDLSADQDVTVYDNSGPGASANLIVSPVDRGVTGNSLIVTQTPDQDLKLPLTLSGAGTLVVHDITTGEKVAPVGLPAPPKNPDDPRQIDITIPASGQARTVSIAWQEPEIPPTLGKVEYEPMTDLTADRPFFFDLGRGGQRSFVLSVPEGGLYRVETLGRQKTSGAIGTAFLPRIMADQANGVGQNMLLQTYLRAGRYRVRVATEETKGHLGIVARPAVLNKGTTLVPGGSVRASLPFGTGVVFPIQIEKGAGGDFTLDLLGLGRTFMARIEDDGGWPLFPVDEITRKTLSLMPGSYRLVVLPQGTDARVIARLRPLKADPVLEGHGPHALPFHETRSHVWREPEDRTAERTPDAWDFTLYGESPITLTLGEGMVGHLVQMGPDGAVQARFGQITRVGRRTLPAGHYRVEARATGRNDRLEYTVDLDSGDLQPDAPVRVGLPAFLPFAIGEDRVVSVTGFGSLGVRGVLRRADGTVVGRFADRTNDWNIAVSQSLAAGRYVLDLSSPQNPGRLTGRTHRPDGDEEEGDEGDDYDSDDEGYGEDGDTFDEDGFADRQITEIRLALPEPQPVLEASLTGDRVLEGGGVHQLTVPVPSDDRLMLARAVSETEVVLTLDHRDETGRWRHVALDQGLAPVVAVPMAGMKKTDGPSPWRLSVWRVDGGADPIRLVSRLVEPADQDPKKAGLKPVDRDLLPGLQVASLQVPLASLLRVGGGDGVLAGSTSGRSLRPVEGDIVAPQSARVWVLVKDRPDVRLETRVIQVLEGAIPLALAPGDKVTLPAAPVQKDQVVLWSAKSPTAQPGMTAGLGMGFARNGITGSAVALAGSGDLSVWNTDGSSPMGVTLQAQPLHLLPQRPVSPQFMDRVPPGSALPVRLPGGNMRLLVDMAPGTAVVARGRTGDDTQTVWSGSVSASYALEGPWEEVLLLNTDTVARPVSYQVVPLEGEVTGLRGDHPWKQFFGAAGARVKPVEARPGQRLVIAGDARGDFLSQDGQIRSGTRIDMNGPGTLTLHHGVGPVAVWLEGEGATPWPVPLTPQPVQVPQSIPLTGDAMALSLSLPTAVLLHVRSSAPVIGALSHGDVPISPTLFPAGADYHRYLPAGDSQLRLMSAHNGPLSGTLDLTSTPVILVTEGIGTPVVVAPGGSVVFGFTMSKTGRAGIGVRAEPDVVSVRVLDDMGTEIGTGIAQLLDLKAGQYLLEARVPAHVGTTVIRPTVVGVDFRPNGPPADVVRTYLDLAGQVPVSAPAR